MGVWTSAFLHQFLDGNPRNYHALEGAPGTPSIFPSAAVEPTPPIEERGFRLVPGHSLRHDFARELGDVIGIDLQLDLQTVPDRAVFATLRTGPDQSLSVNLTGVGNARIRLTVGQHIMDAEPQVPVTGTVKVRARWHTNGQAQLWIDGQLVRYKPDLASLASITVSRIQLNGPPGDPFDGPAPRARFMAVKILRRDDPIRYFDELLPIELVDLPRVCTRQIAGVMSEAQRLLRQFMAGALTRLTSDWQEGAPGRPFSAQSIIAHEAAVAAARDFVLLLTKRDVDAGPRVVEGLLRFLSTLGEGDPIGYAHVIEQLEALKLDLDPECQYILQNSAAAHRDRLDPIVTLLGEIWEKARVAGEPS